MLGKRWAIKILLLLTTLLLVTVNIMAQADSLDNPIGKTREQIIQYSQPCYLTTDSKTSKGTIITVNRNEHYAVVYEFDDETKKCISHGQMLPYNLRETFISLIKFDGCYLRGEDIRTDFMNTGMILPVDVYVCKYGHWYYSKEYIDKGIKYFFYWETKD